MKWGLINMACEICKEDGFLSQGTTICSGCASGLDKFGHNITFFKHAILYLKCNPEYTKTDHGVIRADNGFVHGVDCPKKQHVGRHVHGKKDDTPFKVGRHIFCGRCHRCL